MNPKKKKAIKKNIRSKPKKQMPQDDVCQGHIAYGTTGGGVGAIGRLGAVMYPEKDFIKTTQ